MARCWPPATSSCASRPTTGQFYAQYFEHRFPIAPQHYHHILRGGRRPGASRDLALEFGRIGLHQRDRAAGRAEAAPACGGAAARVAGAGGRRRASRRRSPPSTRRPRRRATRLHRLLERQHYRLAWWRAAADEINWRRFFDITALAGLRVEQPEVFDATHELVLRLYAEGVIDGVRIDHVDGLADPRGYCRKLYRRMQARAAGPRRR